MDEADGLHDPNEFLLPGLPWMLDSNRGDSPPSSLDVYRIPLTIAGGSPCLALALFSDSDLAERFSDHIQAGDLTQEPMEPFRAGNAGDMLTLLQYNQLHGATHVCIDPGPGGRIHGPVLPIGSFAEQFREAGE